VQIARAALDDGRHVLYAAEGAARFALEHGFVRSNEQVMTTAAARRRWEVARPAGPAGGGTVGAVACDAAGTVAAATSTGGTANKLPGRVGDSPLLGAGTYADNEGGACSATGTGEAIMRLCLAKNAVEAMRDSASPELAARSVLQRLASRIAGVAGVIVVNPSRQLGLARTTRTMVWAAASELFAEASGS
jgi:beta-aspartyl-peptidase (threonine type)